MSYWFLYFFSIKHSLMDGSRGEWQLLTALLLKCRFSLSCTTGRLFAPASGGSD